MPENFTAFLATHQWIFILAAVWSIPWKGVALWRAAQNRSVAWFVVLLIVNTLGILDIVYIFAFSKKAEEAPEPEKIVLDMKKEGKMEEKQKVAEDEKREREEKKSDLDEEIQKG